MARWRIPELLARGPDPEAEARIGSHTPLAYRAAARMGRIYPGTDWLPKAMDALYQAAYTYDPARGTFANWVIRNFEQKRAAPLKTHRRREARLPRVDLYDRGTDEPGSLDPGPARAEARLDAASILAAMPPEDRALFLARYVEGRLFREIAADLGITKQAAVTRLRRALEQARGRAEGRRNPPRLPG